MNVQETIEARKNELQGITYECYKCNGKFHYQVHKPDTAYRAIAPVGKQKVVLPDIKDMEQAIELPWLAKLFLFFLDLFKKKSSAPELKENRESYVCVYDKTCDIYYKIPYEVK